MPFIVLVVEQPLRVKKATIKDSFNLFMPTPFMRNSKFKSLKFYITFAAYLVTGDGKLLQSNRSLELLCHQHRAYFLWLRAITCESIYPDSTSLKSISHSGLSHPPMTETVRVFFHGDALN